jgi:RsiW-degrading membrane proteinase PrsW (M82 family)
MVQTEFSSKSVGLGLFLSLIIPAALEEFGKFFVFKKVNKHIQIANTITTTILGMFYAALGFSFFETGAYIYFLSGNNSLSDLIELTFARGIISTFSHVVFSAII